MLAWILIMLAFGTVAGVVWALVELWNTYS